jgi:hypothetical protein
MTDGGTGGGRPHGRIDKAILVKLFAAGVGDKSIAAQFGVSISAVCKARSDLGFRRPRGGFRLSAAAQAEYAKRRSDAIDSGTGGDAAFRQKMGTLSVRFDDDPRLKPASGAGPRPLPLPPGQFSGCGNAAAMCAAAGDAA